MLVCRIGCDIETVPVRAPAQVTYYTQKTPRYIRPLGILSHLTHLLQIRDSVEDIFMDIVFTNNLRTHRLRGSFSDITALLFVKLP